MATLLVFIGVWVVPKNKGVGLSHQAQNRRDNSAQFNGRGSHTLLKCGYASYACIFLIPHILNGKITYFFQLHTKKCRNNKKAML
jgi:hypothetical protein